MLVSFDWMIELVGTTTLLVLWSEEPRCGMVGTGTGGPRSQGRVKGEEFRKSGTPNFTYINFKFDQISIKTLAMKYL